MKILLATSGGIDSMSMLEMAPEIYRGATLCAAHCNFALRGEQSDGDQELVEKVCKEKGIQLFTTRFDTLGHASREGISMEMAARDLRYGWFAKLCAENGFDAVAVAHNADDNAETIFLNILRGTGGRGLRGMSEDSVMETPEGKVRILRPLLKTSREQIRDYALEHGVRWREDATNAESICKRNILRNEVFPLFRKINPSFLRSVTRSIGYFSQENDIAEEYFRTNRGKFEKDGRILLKELCALPHWEYLLFRATEGSGINADCLNDLLAAIKSGRNMAGKRFGPLLTTGNSLILSPSAEDEYVIEEIPASGLQNLKQPAGTIILDSSSLPKPLVIRKWKEGDWMRPLGMKGKKKISDLFVDLKWSADKKANAKVIELYGSHVAALLCERIDGSVRVTPDTSVVTRIKVKGL